MTDAKPWRWYFVRHYFDYVQRWNGMLRAYARDHPDLAVYTSITEVVCHPIASPCNDTIADLGVLARTDGVHYDGPGVDLVIRSLRAQFADVVARMGG
jgi:uncharacterized Fe-S center protein